jgi:hypothetical protein
MNGNIFLVALLIGIVYGILFTILFIIKVKIICYYWNEYITKKIKDVIKQEEVVSDGSK